MTGLYDRKPVPGEWEQSKIDELIEEFVVTREKLEKMISLLTKSFNTGLFDATGGSDCKMLHTHVRHIPDGTEEGNFYALDLGGTNFRVLLVSIKNKEVKVTSEVYSISDELMKGTAEELFGYIAKCLGEFVLSKNESSNDIGTIGFTFSFPVKQDSLTSGSLIHWTKGFKVEGVEGEDVCRLLEEAITKRKEIKVENIALLNDTTGVMMSCAFYDQSVLVGLILGTGTNACYMEEDMKRLQIDDDTHQMIINTEWGNFGLHGALEDVYTPFDRTIDSESINPGEQKFEKMISGMYLGEIVRQCIIHLINAHVLFKGKVTEQMAAKSAFLTKHVSDFCSGEAKIIVDILSSLGYENATVFECKAIQDICKIASLRAAKLAAAGLATIIRRTCRNSVTVAVDGSLFKKHPTFKRYMQQTLDELLPWTVVHLRLAEDGSGVGAAMVAAVAQQKASK